MKWNKRAAKRLMLALIVIVVLWLGWRWVEPRVYLFDLDFLDHDRQGIENAKDHLVGMSKRSVPVILDRLHGSPEFSEGRGACIDVLKRIGETAHRELLDAIDKDNGGHGFDRLGYIYALQASFADFSRLPLWMDSLRHLSGSSAAHVSDNYLARELGVHFKNIPAIADDRGDFTPEFIKWYKKRTIPSGVLPEYDFSRPLEPLIPYVP